jgi:serine/threonine-protein kinase RIO1
VTSRAEPLIEAPETASASAARPRVRRRPSGEAPPLPHQIHASGRWWLLLAAVAAATWIALSTSPTFTSALETVDHAVLTRLASLRTGWLTRAMRVAGQPATGVALQVIWLVNVVLMVVWRRWRHLLIWLCAGIVAINGSEALTEAMHRPRPLGIQILGPWHGFATPSVPMAAISAFLLCTLYANVPAGRPRGIGKLLAGIVLAGTLLSRLYLAQDRPSDALFGLVIGVAVPLLAFRLLAPNAVFPVSYGRNRKAHLLIDSSRVAAIQVAFREQLGLEVSAVVPFGLEGSGGSTPLRVSVGGGGDAGQLFAKLYSDTHVKSDRWYKLARTLMYGRLEDEKAFNTVRRLVQYEDYVLRLLYDAGLPVPKPYGIVEITPEREYLLVMEFFPDAVEIGEAEVDDDIIDQGLQAVRRMWDVGLAHRDIKPANLLVKDGGLKVIDAAFAQVRPSPWRQAVDLANMMLVLALRTDPARVLGRARKYFTDSEIAEAFAATRGITMPSQLRRMIRSLGRDLHGEIVAMLPVRIPRVKIQRWSVRRVCLSLFVVVLAVLAAATAIPLIVNSPI